MRGKIEKWYPLSLGTLFTILCCSYFTRNTLPDSWRDILSSTTTLSGIAIGFLAMSFKVVQLIHNINSHQFMEISLYWINVAKKHNFDYEANVNIISKKYSNLEQGEFCEVSVSQELMDAADILPGSFSRVIYKPSFN